MPERIIEERFNKLAETVEAAAEKVEADRLERERSRQVDERRARWWRRLTVVAVVGSLLGIAGVVGVKLALDQLAADRRQGQVNSCHAYNTQTVPAINQQNDRTQDMLRAFAATSDRPETVQFMEEQVALYEEAKALYRDCSRAGIKAFTEGTGGYLPPGVEP